MLTIPWFAARTIQSYLADSRGQKERDSDATQSQQQSLQKLRDPVQVCEVLPTPAEERPLQTSKKTVILSNSRAGGKMSAEWAQEQVDKFKFDFDVADKDKSGCLSFDEVFGVLKNVGFNGTEEEAQGIFKHLDRNKDNKITKSEFLATLNKLPRMSIKEFVLRRAFKKLDKDNTGFLTREEIMDATKKESGVDISAEKISDMLIFLVKDDDAKVDYEEFLRIFGLEQVATVMGQIFAKMDADGSGFLSREEITNALSSESELNLSATKISDLLCAWCKDDDKKIEYKEFVTVWLKKKEEKTK